MIHIHQLPAEGLFSRWKRRRFLGRVLRSYLCIISLSGAAQSGSPVAAQDPGKIRLDGLQDAEPGAELPPDWSMRAIRGVPVPAAAVLIDAAHGRVLRFEANGEAAFFGRELASPIDPAAGLLRWAWRVDQPIATADLRSPSLDDSPARFFVIFGRPGFLRRSRILFYSWGRAEQKESYWPSSTDPRMAVLVLRNAEDPLGRWLMEERDLQSDFRTVFGREPPEVYGIGFMIDAEDTGEAAVGLLGPVRWVRH